MDYSTAIKKPFTDIKKLAIGILLSIFPIISWFAKGFVYECSGVGKNKASKKMPEWKEFGDFFVKGFISVIIVIIYLIPAIIVFTIGGAAIFFSLIKAFLGNIIPSGTIESIISGDTSTVALKAVIEKNWAYAVPYFISLAPILIIVVILAVLASYVLPVAILSYLKGENLGAALRFNKVFKKAFTGDYFVVWIVAVIISLVSGVVFGWIPLIGRGTAFFISGIISYTLFGEVFRKV